MEIYPPPLAPPSPVRGIALMDRYPRFHINTVNVTMSSPIHPSIHQLALPQSSIIQSRNHLPVLVFVFVHLGNQIITFSSLLFVHSQPIPDPVDGHWWIEIEVGMKALAGMSSRLGVHRISNIDNRGFQGNLPIRSFALLGWAGLGWGKTDSRDRG